ncbi:MAG: hypothetical protein EHM41_10910 [Chloroflexi bacterium]|nr:MAG: hypothetical protein EHM41_10910 [Chloroflexota bacterium]
MHGITTLLNVEQSSQVEELWQFLDKSCGLTGVMITPIPHFSWQVAEAYDMEGTKAILQEMAVDACPFQVYTTGLGIFTGDQPVLYIQIAKSKPLQELHEQLWTRLEKVCSGCKDVYSPQYWVPHITLAHGDVDENGLMCALKKLAFMQFHWEILVDHFAFAYQPQGEVAWVKFLYKFQGV